jgi:hypothetical protein
MSHFFTKVIKLEDGPKAFNDLGLIVEGLQHCPKNAMKIVMRP